MRSPRAERFLWQKSTYSSGQGGNCVEVGVAWRTSTYSSGQGGRCVEVGAAPEFVGVRDTKDRENGQLTVRPAAWRAFVKGVVWS